MAQQDESYGLCTRRFCQEDSSAAFKLRILLLLSKENFRFLGLGEREDSSGRCGGFPNSQPAKLRLRESADELRRLHRRSAQCKFSLMPSFDLCPSGPFCGLLRSTVLNSAFLALCWALMAACWDKFDVRQSPSLALCQLVPDSADVMPCRIA